jgi:hypothetical protein
LSEIGTPASLPSGSSAVRRRSISLAASRAPF